FTLYTTQFYTLSLHDALPISLSAVRHGMFILFYSYGWFGSTHNLKRMRTQHSCIPWWLILSIAPMTFGQKDNKFTILPESAAEEDRKSTRLNSSHVSISYAVF